MVPNVMGSALRLHPLLVIFGLLVGFEVDGLVGALIALPLLAAAGALWAFFSRAARARAVDGRAPRSRSRSSPADRGRAAEPVRPVAVDR